MIICVEDRLFSWRCFQFRIGLFEVYFSELLIGSYLTLFAFLWVFSH
jgi:hypothetical protein